MLKNKTDIDVVITWVDGSDPKHKAKLNSYLESKNRNNIGASKTRFGSVNEIKYCVLSILKFAPFVRKIFIITDNQKPNIEDDIKEMFPDRINSIYIVDHKEIFEGYEQYLPTFNSITIEAFMWRIKGLSDKFVYFNDDLFVMNHLKPEDWFCDGRPVLRGSWQSKPTLKMFGIKLIGYLKKIILRTNEVNLNPAFKISQWWAAELVGFKKSFFRKGHTPSPINRNIVEQYFNENKDVFLKNIAYKFRNYNQFNLVTLANHLEIKNGNTLFEDNKACYISPVNRGKNYVDRKITLFKNIPDLKFFCAQSLDIASEKDRNKILQWLEYTIKK